MLIVKDNLDSCIRSKRGIWVCRKIKNAQILPTCIKRCSNSGLHFTLCQLFPKAKISQNEAVIGSHEQIAGLDVSMTEPLPDTEL